MVEMLKSKIHRATITDANLNYEGSITIYKQLMELANIYEYEKVTVVDIDNGNRFDTYVIEGRDEKNPICINGAAARLVCVGDKVIIMSYQAVKIDKRNEYKPVVVFVDHNNQPLQTL